MTSKIGDYRTKDIIEALKIEDDVLAQIERVCGRQLHRLSVEHDVLQRMLQNMPNDEDESGQHQENSHQDSPIGSCPGEAIVKASTKSTVAKKNPALDKKLPSPWKKKEKGRNKRNARNPPPSFDKTKRKRQTKR